MMMSSVPNPSGVGLPKRPPVTLRRMATTTLKDRIQLAMKEADVKPVDLARACGVRPPSVSDWINGKTKTLAGTNLIRAAALLNVNAEWLGTGRGPMRLNASVVNTGSEKNSRGDVTSESRNLGPDPVILHEALTLLLFDLDHGGERTARSASSLLLDLYRRIAAAGGQLPDNEVEAFEQQARSRRQQGERNGRNRSRQGSDG